MGIGHLKKRKPEYKQIETNSTSIRTCPVIGILMFLRARHDETTTKR